MKENRRKADRRKAINSVVDPSKEKRNLKNERRKKWE